MLKNVVLWLRVLAGHYPDGFDPIFYRQCYTDLRDLSAYRLLRHYQSHGRVEGRFGSRQEALARFSASGNKLPEDFNAALYGQLNPDLRLLFDWDAQFELHFLQHGRSEQRPYKAEGQVEASNWRSVFQLYDFQIYSKSWRTQTNLSLAEAWDLFEREGVPRLVPIACGWDFDPVFYKENNKLAIVDPVVLYRDWLDRGFAAGLAPNERFAIFPLTAGRDYPAAFDWQRYMGRAARSRFKSSVKMRALACLFEQPLDALATSSIAQEKASDLYTALGDYHLKRGAAAIAIGCYDRVLAAGRNGASFHTRRGTALRQCARDEEAVAEFSKALTYDGYPIQACIGATELLTKAGDFQAAFDLLVRSRSTWAGHSDFRKTVDRFIDAFFSTTSDQARDAIAEGNRVGAEKKFSDDLRFLTEVISSLKEPKRLSLPPTARRVVMLACLDLPQCTHYRVNQKIEFFGAQGVAVDVVDFNEPQKFMDALPGAAAAIFYRVPAYPKIIESILYAEALGLTTYYDIDDLIFSSEFPDSFESYEGQISPNVHVELQHGVPLYRHAISLCDIGLVSTRSLVSQIKPLLRSKTAFVVANGLDSTSSVAMRLGSMPKLPASAVTIFYGSGTKAHNRDFNTLIGPALIKLMSLNDMVRLVVVGHLRLDTTFEAFEDRVQYYPFIEETSQYWSLLASCDINVSALTDSVISDCKSEIKWLEAAVVSIPSVVSRTATFAEIVDPSVDGLLAADALEWFENLSRLVENEPLRKRMGLAARAKALERYAPAKIGADLFAAFPTLAGPRTDQGSHVPLRRVDSKRRILICHVFFTPQTYGGATRVVEANVDYFVDHLGAEFEIGILATDEGATAPGLRVENYRGCVVFRMAPTQNGLEDWEPFNEANKEPYRRVLELFSPQLVHFHSIQRLTASLVEETLDQGIPYIITAHDAWWISDHQFLVDQRNQLVTADDTSHFNLLPKGVTRAQSIERRERLASLMNNATAVAVVSSSFGEIYRLAGTMNVVVVENGLSSLPPLLELASSQDKLVLGHIGGNSAHKGATLTEIAFRQGEFSNLELIMIDHKLGYGEERETYWGKTRVLLRGNYPQNRINELFASFDVLLAPSIWPESYGLVTREAAYYGKYIVASNRGAIGADIQNEDHGICIDVSDATELMQILTIMNANYLTCKHRSLLCANLRSSDDQAVALAKLYRDTLGSSSQPAVAQPV